MDSAIDLGSAIDSSCLSGSLKVELPEVTVDPPLLVLQLEIHWNCSFSLEVPSPHQAENGSFAVRLTRDIPNSEH